jgi:hypothetical protein
MTHYWPDLALVTALVLVNGVLAGSEAAYISLREGQLREFECRATRRERIVVRLARKPNRFLATIQLAGPHAQVANRGKRVMQVPCCLGVHDDDLTVCVDPSRQHRVGILDHQLYFKADAGMSATGGDDVGPKRQVRHESAVHHVSLDPIDTRVLQLLDLLAQP